MLPKRSFRSSTITSRRFNHRARLTADQIKILFKKVLPFVFAAFVLIIFNSLFVIKKIDCRLNDQPCSGDIQKNVDRYLGKNSLFVNQKELVSSINALYPVDKADIHFRLFNTLKVELRGNRPFVQIDAYLIKDLPVLSMDQAPSTTDSASWWTRPTIELQSFVDSKEALGFDLWNNGVMTPVATVGAKISYIFSEKPDSTIASSVYKLVTLVSKYNEPAKIFIVNQRCFLSLTGQPDIIVNVPFEEGSLEQALQSLSYLVTIKEDAKVIDLSFRNPIIR